MAALATQSIRRSGLSPSYAAATGGGDTCVPGANTFLHVKNGSGGALTVTLAAKAVPLTDMTIGNLAVAIPGGQERMIGPVRPEVFGDPSAAGVAAITYSGVTSLTIGVFDLSQP